MSYEYRITSKYCWYDCDSHTAIVKMYFVNGMPFTFDELEDGRTYDNDIIQEAKRHHRSYTPEDLYRFSFYLMEEEMHPMLFPIQLENPEDLPDDPEYYQDKEDLLG